MLNSTLSSSSIIIDNGSETIKAGFNTNHPTSPSVLFASVVGRSNSYVNPINGEPATFIGQKLPTKYNLTLNHSIQNGLIKNWNDLELIWKVVFNQQLGTNPKDHSVLLTYHTMSSECDLQKMSEIMFEKFQTPFLQLANQAFLALYATNRTTGVVLDSGSTQTQCVAFKDGRIQPGFITDFKLTGSQLTKFLIEILNRYSIGELANGKEIAQSIKDKLCCTAFKFQPNILSKLAKEYMLPDGNIIKLDTERFKCAEALFEPSLLDLNIDGIDTIINKCILASDSSFRNDLYANIVLSGGNTMFPIIGERLKICLSKQVHNTAINVIAEPERRFLTWIGGNKWTSKALDKNMWISKADYEENGSAIIKRKCL